MTTKEINEVLKDVTIIVDNREKKNQHILEYFDLEGIPYKVQKVETADYTVEFSKPEYQRFNECVLVERKNSWDEIIGNFTKNRDRFVREFERVRPDQYINIVIETATWRTLFSGSYRSKAHPKSIMASMFTWRYRYDCPIWMCTTKQSPVVIHELLYYGVMETVKKESKNA